MTPPGEKPQNKTIRAPWEHLPLARGPDVVFFVVGGSVRWMRGEGRTEASEAGRHFGGVPQDDLMAHHHLTAGFLAGHQVQQHPAGGAPQSLRVKLYGRNAGVEPGGQLAVVEAGHPHLIRHPDLTGLQLQRDVKGQPVVPAEDAVGAALQDGLQRVDPLDVGLDAGVDQPRVGLDAPLGHRRPCILWPGPG